MPDSLFQTKVKCPNNFLSKQICPIWIQFVQTSQLSAAQGIGPMDGSLENGTPDRRIDAMHTLYRDAEVELAVLRVVIFFFK